MAPRHAATHVRATGITLISSHFSPRYTQNLSKHNIWPIGGYQTQFLGTGGGNQFQNFEGGWYYYVHETCRCVRASKSQSRSENKNCEHPACYLRSIRVEICRLYVLRWRVGLARSIYVSQMRRWADATNIHARGRVHTHKNT